MANNRMWLVHRPTGKRIFIAKRMGLGWYGVPDDLGAKVRALLDETGDDYNFQDDFALALEDNSMAPLVIGQWHYEDNRIVYELPVKAAENSKGMPR